MDTMRDIVEFLEPTKTQKRQFIRIRTVGKFRNGGKISLIVLKKFNLEKQNGT